MRDAFSPIMIEGALVLPDVSVGMTDASATRNSAHRVLDQPREADRNARPRMALAARFEHEHPVLGFGAQAVGENCPAEPAPTTM
jgi:hypothetical protein